MLLPATDEELEGMVGALDDVIARYAERDIMRFFEVRLHLHALAYNLATFLRCIELPEAMADWSLTSLQLKLIKIGARGASRPRHHLPAGRGGRYGPDGQRHPCRHPRLRAPPSCA